MRFQPTVFLGTLGALNITQTGLIFDFKASDYVSGSTTWNAAVGDYTASVTGTVAGGLTYIDGTSVGFNGNQWLQFSNNMTASISSSSWEVYSLVSFTNAQTASTSFTPEFFSKGAGVAPAWNYAYQGGTIASAGFGNMGGGSGNNGYTTDSLNSGLRGINKQLFAMSHIPSASFTISSYITVNWRDTVIGSTGIFDYPDYYVTFTGSAAAPLLFGKGIDAGTQNISGSVIRLFAYNRILSAQERKSNWFALTGQYIP